MTAKFQLRVKASGLSSYLLRAPNCSAHIAVDGGRIITTGVVSGTTNPEWPECFDLSLTQSSTITIQIFHISSPLKEVLRGTAEIHVGELLPEGNETIVHRQVLHQPGMTYRKGGFVIVSLSRNQIEVGPSDLYYTVAECMERMEKASNIVPQVNAGAHLASKVLKDLSGQITHDNKIKSLLTAIRDMLDFVNEPDAVLNIGKLHPIVSSMIAESHTCALFIQEYERQDPETRKNLSATTNHRIQQFITTFKHMRAVFDEKKPIEPSGTERMDAAEAEKILERLPGWDLDGIKFSEPKACLGGTRRQLLDDIRAWAYSPDQKPILWLSGGAGTGKTSVANSIAVSFDAEGCLGASFFFNRDTAGLNNPNYLFGNLCYQLAHFDERGQFRNRVLSAILKMGHIAGSSLHTQARKLLVDTAKAEELVGLVLIVIDDINESGTAQTRRELLDTIATEFPKLPRFIKIMITSRDEPDIRAALRGCAQEVCIDDAKKTEEDIAAYIQHRLTVIRRRSFLTERWPGADKLRELVRRAGRLFVWASVACNFIEENWDPVWRLKRLLDATSGPEGQVESPLKKLDTLYNSVLRDAFPDDVQPLTEFRYIVGSIVTLEAPLTQIGLDSLLGLGEPEEADVSSLLDGDEIYLSSSVRIVSHLGSILKADSTDSTGKDGPLRLLHPSLYEFLTSRADEPFRINPSKQNQILAVRCLTLMNNQLRFDICEIGDPSLLNTEINDLPRRISDHISDGLRYSCRSAGYHLVQVSDPDGPLRDALQKFVTEHLLHWIEAMSLLGEVSKAEDSLHLIAAWIKEHMSEDINSWALVDDAIPFLRNSGQAVRLSALHTYFSALPLTPKTANLFTCFIQFGPNIPDITSSSPTWPAASVRIMEGHTDAVRRVAFSPDGRMLASASHDKAVRLWDVGSGQIIGEPLEGHVGRVNFVTFSPDGNKLASASDDKTVWLWDGESGQATGEALEGHTDIVTHVQFSPDGKNLVSASLDKTLQLWNLEDDNTTGRILEGHTNGIKHVVFSPDGLRIASASRDNTVRLWDVRSGQTMMRPLRGHTDWVNCVVFSPDGQKLASASSDGTVKLWDVKSGKAIGQALKGHTDAVRQVVFSPDGNKLASSSDDKTVWLWDIESGQAVGKALRHHTDWVRYAAFSPDGKRLASASSDQTVQLWDVKTGQSVGEALKGHTDLVEHVVFSPDSQKLVSASRDKTVQLWDIERGGSSQPISQFSKGHTSFVNCVVFSPDGKKLASGSDDKTVRLWNVETGHIIGKPFKGHNHGVGLVKWSPDGNKLVSAAKTVCLWDVEKGQAIGEAVKGHTDRVVHVMFSPDGKKLASASQDWTIWLWDTESGQAIGEALKGHTNWVYHVVFSPDGQKLASASSDQTVRIWDVKSGQPIGGPLEGHTHKVVHLVFSPDGKKLASASHDKTVQIWDVETCQAFGEALKGHNGWVNYVMFSPDGQKLVSASSDQTIRLWDVESGQVIGEALEGHTSWVNHVMFSPDGMKLASASSDNTVRLWDVQTGQAIGEALQGHTSSVNYVVFSPCGEKLASASFDQTVQLWDVNNGKAIGQALKGHTSAVCNVMFSPQGTMLASASNDQMVQLWDTESGQALGEPLVHAGKVKHVTFSPDGNKVASASFDGTVRVWDVKSGQVIGNTVKSHTRQIQDVAFSPDGKKVASASDDKTVWLWDAESGQAIGEALKGHSGKVVQVVFSPDGKRLASASHDRTVQLWDVESGQLIGALNGHTGKVVHVMFSPDGKMLASASDDQTVRLWDAEDGQRIREVFDGHRSGVRHVMFSPDGRKLASVSDDKEVRLWDVDNVESVNSEEAPSIDAISRPRSTNARILDITSDSSIKAVLDSVASDMGEEAAWATCDSVDQLLEATMSFDEQGFLRYGTKRLVWLPVMLRGPISAWAHAALVAVGGRSGAITMIRLAGSE